MELKDLKIGKYYYLTDMSYCTYDKEIKNNEQLFYNNYDNFLEDPLKLIEIGKYRNDIKNPIKGEKKYNDIKLLHRKSGVIIYSCAEYLKENKQDSLEYQKNISSILDNLFTNLTFATNPYIGMINKENSWSKNDSNLFDIHLPNSKLSIKLAKEEEFKIRKLATKEKVQLLMYKLEFLIDKSLENNNQNKFNLYSGRYNKIKNKYSELIKK